MLFSLVYGTQAVLVHWVSSQASLLNPCSCPLTSSCLCSQQNSLPWLTSGYSCFWHPSWTTLANPNSRLLLWATYWFFCSNQINHKLLEYTAHSPSSLVIKHLSRLFATFKQVSCKTTQTVSAVTRVSLFAKQWKLRKEIVFLATHQNWTQAHQEVQIERRFRFFLLLLSRNF